MKSETNWCVVTGGPSSGKTTTVNILRRRGYTTTIEHARHYIDTERVTGKTVAEIRANQIAFQRAVIDMQIEQEASLDPQANVFLDRALPDALAYYRFLSLGPDADYLARLRPAVYRAVFVLDLLPLAPDNSRTEDRQAQLETHRLLTEGYAELGHCRQQSRRSRQKNASTSSSPHSRSWPPRSQRAYPQGRPPRQRGRRH